MNKTYKNCLEPRYCVAYKVIGGQPCGTDISDKRKNAKYCDKCKPLVLKFNADKFTKSHRRKQRAESRARIDREFQDYHYNHPEIYNGICNIARWVYKDAGVIKTSVRSIFYKMRADGYKIPNNFSRPYRELIEKQEPDLRGFFTGGKSLLNETTNPTTHQR